MEIANLYDSNGRSRNAQRPPRKRGLPDPMNCLPARKVRLFRLCALALSSLIIGASSGQSGSRANDDEVRLVIVLARHGVRAPIESEIRSNIYNTEPWPSWPVQPGVLTTHGAEALRLLGGYYRARYVRLLSHTPCESSGVYAEANTTQRTIASAHAFMMGLRPDCEIKVHFLAESEGRENPLYLPALNDLTDRQRLAAAIGGRMNGRPDWFTDAFSATLNEMQRVLSGCNGQRCDGGRVDLRASQEQVRVPAGPGLVDVDGPVSRRHAHVQRGLGPRLTG